MCDLLLLSGPINLNVIIDLFSFYSLTFFIGWIVDIIVNIGNGSFSSEGLRQDCSYSVGTKQKWGPGVLEKVE